MLKRKGLFLWLVICAFLVSSGPQRSSEIVYLTYTGDPTTSMTVQWHSPASKTKSMVSFRKQGEEVWKQGSGNSIKPDKIDVRIHRVDLISLDPNALYEFRIGGSNNTYLFRTLPSSLEDRAVQFVIGGDSYRSLSTYRKTNKQIAKQDPDFVVVGGDIAYTYSNGALFKGKNWEIKRWHTFFTEWKTTLVGKGGRMIPIVPVVGNHDVPKRLVNPSITPVLFYQLFAFAKENVSYRAIDIGSYLSFVLLDTDHTYPIQGDQTEWLKKTLEQRSKVPYKFAVYHIGAYPSVYKYTAKIPARVREFWCPLFEENGVQLCFENHNHAYKRTFPIKQEQINAEGVIYMGDGCWGVKPRATLSKAWYLEKKMKTNCFSLISLTSRGCDVVSYSNTGKVIDVVPHFSGK